MNRAKFTMNALVLVVTIFSALAFFFTVVMVNLADRTAVNEYIPIEGTDYAIRYSSLEPSGLYQGPENTCWLVTEGEFGSEWGACKVGDNLYLNEYRSTELGLLLCDLVRIDLNTHEKTVLYRDTILRGTCASGELVCVRCALLPANFPETNPLCRFYRLTEKNDAPEGAADVVFLDPQTLEEVYTETVADPLGTDFEVRYLQKTLTEVAA